MTLVDSNVLIDIIGRDPNWWEWSASRMDEALLRGHVFINDVIFAETSIRYDDVRDFQHALSLLKITIAVVPQDALFLAGKMFARYRRTGGERTGVLPDFFIGAHAAVSGLPLLTRDVRRYRSYFPTLQLIAPDTI